MSTTSYYVLLILHILGATIWTGGHLVLATAVLPRALRARRAGILTDFEQGYEKVGMPALAVQVVTGLWLAHRLLGAPGNWFAAAPLAHVVQFKLLCLAGTAALAIHAKTRVLPRLSDATLPVMAWHIAGVAVFSVLFVLAGASARLGGFPFFQP
ncbi:MAG: CopD family protein [Verrucomicrobiota bacterium]